tara:strand:+ start:125 stop:559 length:435 start_codon:yes stop_codon:yes gene_type:complete
MKKGTKYLLISIALTGFGTALYFALKSSGEDNGVLADPNAPLPEDQETQNTTGDTAIVVGDTLYPSGTNANVRTEPNVNNGFWNNLIKNVPSPTAIGVVIAIVPSEGHTWYRVVWFEEQIMNSGNTIEIEKQGYVRADVVTKNI